MNKTKTKQKRVSSILAEFFHRNGYLRVPDAVRRKKEDQQYKKGYEIRFVAKTNAELRTIRTLLRRAGVKAGRPFSKHLQTVQPVYGKRAVESLCKALGIK